MLGRLKQLAGGLGIAAALTLAGTTLTTHARACGGFFCSLSQPVNQAAERIIFSKNADGTVTAVVQIQYQGPSENFAWMLPVPGKPDVGISSDIVFQRLQAGTNPQYQLMGNPQGMCPQVDFAAGGPTSANGSGSESDDRVVVVDEGSVGPFDYVTISVRAGDSDPADVAIEWLTDEGYDVDEFGREQLRPYLEGGMNLIAFRLTKGVDSGSIRPIVMTYESERPMIPIRPTAVAAEDDMGVLVWVLGESRAVPVNYKGLELNDALINWFNPNSNYNDVVIAAANEAEGQGFVTEYAQKTSELPTVFAESERSSLERAQQLTDARQFLEELTWTYGGYDGYPDVVREHVTLRAGVTVEEFVQCVSCYFEPTTNQSQAEPDPALDVDQAAFAASVEEDVLQPMEVVQKLLDSRPYVTRMYTTMSADEMTLDPEFDFNPDLEDVSNIHMATRTFDCNEPNGSWIITLEDGTQVRGTGRDWPFPIDGSLPATRRILSFGTTGPGNIAVSNVDAIRAAIGSNNQDQPDPTTDVILAAPGEDPSGSDSGGCSVAAPGQGGTPLAPLAALLGAGALVALRRRRRS